MKLMQMSPLAVAQMLGERIKQARLNANISRAELAGKTGLSLNAVLNAELGKSQLETLIAVLQGLDLVEQLNLFLPEQPISPIQLAKLQGKKRQRASRSVKNKSTDTATNSSKDTPSW